MLRGAGPCFSAGTASRTVQRGFHEAFCACASPPGLQLTLGHPAGAFWFGGGSEPVLGHLQAREAESEGWTAGSLLR